MDVSRIKIKGQLFTIKDPVSRDLANAASETANNAAADVATAFNTAQEAKVTANAANNTANIAEDNATIAINKSQEAVDTANAANTKAEQALSRYIPTKISELQNDAGFITSTYVDTAISELNLPTSIESFDINISISNYIEGTLSLRKFGRVCSLFSDIHTIGNLTVGVYDVTLSTQIPSKFLPCNTYRAIVMRSDSANDNFGTLVLDNASGGVHYAVNTPGVTGVYLNSCATYITKE